MSAKATNPYAELVAAGVEIDNHESDLYAKATPEAMQIVERSGWSWYMFSHVVTGEAWIEVPFAFMPWFEKRAGEGIA